MTFTFHMQNAPMYCRGTAVPYSISTSIFHRLIIVHTRLGGGGKLVSLLIVASSQDLAALKRFDEAATAANMRPLHVTCKRISSRQSSKRARKGEERV